MSNSVVKVITTSKGIEIWTESFGEPANEPILLIMGAMNQGLFWPQVFCEALAKAGYLVIRYDNRDTGQSSVINYMVNPYTLDDMAEDAVAILDAYNLPKASIMGMSMGGYIAQLIAINYADRLNKLILLSTSADQRPYMYSIKGTFLGQFLLSPPSDQFLFHLTQAAFYLPKTPEDTFKFILDGWRAVHGGSLPFPEQEVGELIKQSLTRIKSPTAAMNHSTAVDNSPDRMSLLDNIKAPTLVLHGEFDPCLPLDHGQYLAEHITGAKLIKLDMGHLFPPPMSQQLADHVLAFVKP